MIGYLALLHAVAFRSLLTSSDPVITGRYLLPLVVLYGLAIALAVAWLPRRWAPVAGGVAVVVRAAAPVRRDGRAVREVLCVGRPSSSPSRCSWPGSRSMVPSWLLDDRDYLAVTPQPPPVEQPTELELRRTVAPA